MPSKPDKQRKFARFKEIFKQLHINMPFLKALERMLVYVRFMKDILIEKRKFIE